MVAIAAISVSPFEIFATMKTSKYNEVEKEFKLGLGPKLLYKDLDFASKYVKDNVNDDIEKIITHLPRLISELEAQGLPARSLAPLQNESNRA